MNLSRILAVLTVALAVTAISGMALAQQQGQGTMMGQGMGAGAGSLPLWPEYRLRHDDGPGQHDGLGNDGVTAWVKA